jgi:hypothetical protein
LPNAADWVVQDDGFGFPCFTNLQTEAVVYEDPMFVYDVDEDIAVQRQYVLQVFPYYLRGKSCEVSRASASSGGAIRNELLQGSLGRFRKGYFAGSRAADQTSYTSSR